MDNELANQKRSQFTAKEKTLASGGLAACMFLFVIMEWSKPSLPPFTGRWSWVYRIAYETFGTHGVAVMWGIFAVILSFIALWDFTKMNRNG